MTSESPSWQTLLGMGMAIAVLLVVGMGLGWLVDTLLGTVPIFILVGLVAGIAAAVAYTSTKFRQYLKT